MSEIFNIFYPMMDRYLEDLTKVASQCRPVELEDLKTENSIQYLEMLDDLKSLGVHFFLNRKIDQEKADIIQQKTDPTEDWKMEIEPKVQKGLLGEEIMRFLHLSIKQLAFANYLLDIKVDIIDSEEDDQSRQVKLDEVFAKIAVSLQKGSAFLGMLGFLTKQRHMVFHGGAQAGGKRSAEKRFDDNAMLIGMVRHLVKKERPRAGWSNFSDAAKKIVNTIFPFLEDNEFPLAKDKSELEYKINTLLTENKEISELYEKLNKR